MKESIQKTKLAMQNFLQRRSAQVLASQIAAAGIGIETSTELGDSTFTLFASVPVLIFCAKKLSSEAASNGKPLAVASITSGIAGSVGYYATLGGQGKLLPLAVGMGVLAMEKGANFYYASRDSNEEKQTKVNRNFRINPLKLVFRSE